MPSYSFQRVTAVNLTYSLTSNVPAIVRQTGSALSKVVDRISTVIWQSMQTSLMIGTRTGRIYIRRGGIEHQASAPGEPPASETGQLVGSINKKMVDPLNAIIDTQNNEYAAALEFGRIDGSIAPRPFFVKAVLRYQLPFVTEANEALKGI